MIIIPAHNEARGISSTLGSCLCANYPGSLLSVVVIADNCTDDTAAVAADAGVSVIERFDSTRISKGYVIGFLIDMLVESGGLDLLDAVVIIDADTTIDPDLLRYFDQGLNEGHDWIQCYYTVANPDHGWRTRLMTYAFSLFNGVMLLGENALGTSAGFVGNGMCLSTRGLRRRPWCSFGLNEDMEYSWVLRIAGEKIAFQSEVSVYGAMLGSCGEAMANQRRRWEYGRTQVRNAFLLPLLRTRRLSWWEKSVSFCRLSMPSLAGLSVLYGILMASDLAIVFWSGTDAAITGWTLAAFSLFMTLALWTYAISPFLAMRLPWKYASSLLFVPLYLSWKLLIRLGGRPRQWIRTAREWEIELLGRNQHEIARRANREEDRS
jgi:cellulose synthase/poly-beta-1,6-N-acetylglucosamine synthase-like glycosyltransferase